LKEENVLAFVGATIKSVWALEVLLFLLRDGKKRTPNEIERELRGSPVAVKEAVQSLRIAGLVAENEGGTFGYSPASPTLDEAVAAIAALYMLKPVAIIRAIAASPSTKLKSFSDAFRFRD